MKKVFFVSLFIIAFISTVSFGQITSAATGNWSAGATWVGGVVPSATDDVIIADGHKVTLDGNYTVANLTVGGGTSGEFNTSKTVTCTLTVTGNIIGNAGSAIRPQSSGTGVGPIIQTIILYGNFTFNGGPSPAFNLRSGSSSSVPPTVGVLNFEFVGSSNSIISGSSYTLQGNAFNAIKINKSGGAKVIIANTIYILAASSNVPTAASTLQFVNGLVETGDNTIIHQSSTDSHITGASSNSYIIGNFASTLSQKSRLFPVGDAVEYRPIRIRSTTTSGNSSSLGYHWVNVRAIPGNANTGTSILTSDIDRVSAVRYYKFAYNQGTTTTTSMGFNLFSPSYGTDDGVAAGNTNLRVAYSTDERVNWNGLPQSVVHTTNLTTPPTTIDPDSLATALVLNTGQSIYVALARVTGTNENSLGGPSAVEQEEGIPTSFELSQNYPNPFNPATSISFAIPQSTFVSLKVYDVIGKEIATLVNGEQTAGNYNVNFDASEFSSGVYLYRLSTPNSVITKKMILIK